MQNTNKKWLSLIILIIVGFNFWLWWQVAAAGDGEVVVYFLDVGQGDSQLIIIPPVKILIDGGKGKQALSQLDKVLNSGDRYIDLVIMTHSDLDHFGGLVDVLERYQIGTFIYNGRDREMAAFKNLKENLSKMDIPVVALRAGDRIKYLDNKIEVLAPTAEMLITENNNESGLVLLAEIEKSDILFSADIGFKTENWLLINYPHLAADVLKVAHHGSKNSTSQVFLAAIRPKISVIGVGKNSYGHPHPRVLKTLEESGSLIYRTDLDGTIKLILDEK